jgi:hypothetical protein
VSHHWTLPWSVAFIPHPCTVFCLRSVLIVFSHLHLRLESLLSSFPVTIFNLPLIYYMCHTSLPPFDMIAVVTSDKEHKFCELPIMLHSPSSVYFMSSAFHLLDSPVYIILICCSDVFEICHIVRHHPSPVQLDIL